MSNSIDVFVKKLEATATTSNPVQNTQVQGQTQQVTNVSTDNQQGGQATQQPIVDFDKEIDELLAMTNASSETTNNTTVNTETDKKEVKVPEYLSKKKEEPITLEELEEMDKYISSLEDDLEREIFEKRKETVAREQYEKMYQDEVQRKAELADRVRSLEWEVKNAKVDQFPDELKNLGDFFKLHKEKPDNYRKTQLIGETINLLEGLTNVPGDALIEYRLRQQSNSNMGESNSSGVDIPQQMPQKNSGKDEYLSKLAF